MQRLLITAGAAALALAASGAAQAQDWTGGYVGGHVGYSTADSDGNERILFDTDQDGRFDDTVNTTAPANAFSPGFCNAGARTNAPGGGCTEDDDSWDFGLRAGYDKQFGRFVIGGVAEVSRQELEDSVSGFSTTPASYTMTREVDWTVGLRVRGGVAFDKFLIYGTAGPSYAKIKSSFRTTNGANAFTERGDDEGTWGYQAGFGGEMKVTERVTLGLEYLFNSYEDDSYRVRASQGTAPATNPFILVDPTGTDFKRSDSDFDFSSIRFTAAYRF